MESTTDSTEEEEEDEDTSEKDLTDEKEEDAVNKASIDLETEEEVSSDYDADCSSALESPRKVALVSSRAGNEQFWLDWWSTSQLTELTG